MCHLFVFVVQEHNYVSKEFSLIGELSKTFEKMLGSRGKETRLKLVLLLCAGFVYRQVSPCIHPLGVLTKKPTPSARGHKN